MTVNQLNRILYHCDNTNNKVNSDKYRLSTFVGDLQACFDKIKQEDRQKVIATLNGRIELRKAKETKFYLVTRVIQRLVNCILLRGFATTAERAEKMAAKFGHFDPKVKEYWAEKVLMPKELPEEFKEAREGNIEQVERKNTLCESLACFPGIKTNYTYITPVLIGGSQSAEPAFGRYEHLEINYTPQNSLVIWIVASDEQRKSFIKYGDITKSNFIGNKLGKHTHCYLDIEEYKAMTKNPRLLPQRLYDIINNQK